MKRIILAVFVVMICAGLVMAAEKTIPMHLVNDQGMGEAIGVITVTDTAYGLLLTPQLTQLPQGIHGFHVHQNADCGHMMTAGKSMAAGAAGGHYDPAMTGKHEGPYGSGHLGDLPFLYADKDGKATASVLAPRLKVSDLQGRSLMIHVGGDNYSDVPEKLGGGGGRLACGVVK